MYLQMKIPLVFQISNMTMLVCQIKNKPQFRHGKKLRKINIFLLRPITSRVTKETVAYKLFLFNSYEYMILACLQSTVLILTLFTYLNVIKMWWSSINLVDCKVCEMTNVNQATMDLDVSINSHSKGKVEDSQIIKILYVHSAA